MKGRQKPLFRFLSLFFLALSRLNFSCKFELTTFSFSLSKVSSLLPNYFSQLRGNGNQTCLCLCQHDLKSLILHKIQAFSKSYFFFTLLLSFTIYLFARFLLGCFLLIFLCDDIKKHSREKGVIYDVFRNREFQSYIAFGY